MRERSGGTIELIQLTIVSTMIVPVWFAYKYARGFLLGGGDYRVPYRFMMVQLGIAALAVLSLAVVQGIRSRKHAQQSGKGGVRRQAIYVVVAAIYLLAAGIAPAIMINIGDTTGALERAQYRYHQGKWGEAVAIYRCLPFRGENEVVRSMQALLKDAGYYDAPVDGISLRHILSSLRQLQRDYGLVPDAVLGPKTRTILFGRVYREILGVGDAAVKEHEKIRDAVIRFQQTHGLNPDGDIGWKTAITLGEEARACAASNEN